MKYIGWISAALIALCAGAYADDALPAHAAPSLHAAPSIVLPVEVLGPDGTTAARQFRIPDTPNFNKRLKLWLEIHALRYETEASYQLNGGPWIPINSDTVMLRGLAGAFGGIGGGFSTLTMTLNLRVDDVRRGDNTITFRFNGTDGIRSGFRVLDFNIVTTDGARLIAKEDFTEDDPAKWQPPFTSASDIQAGKELWNAARLTAPGFGALRAKCSSCHAQDGRDLKYFNYSNLSIRARSMFHGLTPQQGDQIASYIRSLDFPNPGRPWNPPYQPGPGMDSKPVANWAAGAGLDAVLNSDAEMEAYLMPGGSTAGWSATSYLNPREIPIPLQMLDWNSWLPQIHPMDAFGSRFIDSDLNHIYSTIRSTLQPNSPEAYKAALGTFHNWFMAGGSFLVPVEAQAQQAKWDSKNLRSGVYSVALWQMVKMWELNQEFGLEGMARVPFGDRANSRGWIGNTAFFTSPNMLHIPPGPGIGNGSEVMRTFLAFIWYETQLMLNDGQGTQAGHTPIDFPYVSGFIKALFATEAKVPGIMTELEWQIKALQEFTLTGIPPSATADDGGWHVMSSSMVPFLDHDWQPLWSATSPATRAKLMQAYMQAWFNQASKYTPRQYQESGWAKATDNPAKLFYSGTFGGMLWYSLPRLRFVGVDPKLTAQITAWAATIWPTGDWGRNRSATCASLTECTSDK